MTDETVPYDGQRLDTPGGNWPWQRILRQSTRLQYKPFMVFNGVAAVTQQMHLSRAQNAIAQALETHPDGLTPEQIGALTGHKDRMIRNHLYNLRSGTTLFFGTEVIVIKPGSVFTYRPLPPG